MNKLNFIARFPFGKAFFAKRPVQLLCKVIYSLLAIVFILLLLLLGRLSMGPINLDFLTSDIEAALNSPQVGLSAKIEHTQLVWKDWKRPFEIELVNVHLVKDQNPSWLRIEHVGVSIKFLRLFGGAIALNQLRFYRPHILLERDERGDFSFGFGETSPNQEYTFKEVMPLLTIGESNPSFGKLNDLSKITIIDADVLLKDNKLNQTWELPKTTFTLRRQVGGFRTELKLEPKEGNGVLTLDIAYQIGASRIDANVDFHHLSFKDLFDNKGLALCQPGSEIENLDDLLNFFQCWALPLHGKVHIAFVPETLHVIEGSCDVNLSKGTLDLSVAKAVPLPINSGNLSLNFSPHKVQLNKAALLSDGMFFELSGNLESPSSPLSLSKLLTSGQTLTLQGNVEDLLLDHISALWPQNLANNAREWITQNLRKGTVTEAKFNFKGHGEEDGFVLDELNGTVQGEDAELTYLEGLPPVQKVAAYSTFDRKGFDITILSGEINNIKVDGGRVLISDLDTDNESLRLEVKTHGPLSDILDVINHKPLEYASYGGIDPKKAKGQGDVNLQVNFPLIANLEFKDVKIKATGEFKKVALQREITKEQIAQLSSGELSLNLTQDQMLIKGKGILNELPSTLIYTHYFKNPRPYEFEILVEAIASFEDFKRFGFDYLEYAKGPTKTKFTYTFESKDKSRLSLNMDIAPATLTFLPLEWKKKSGDPGTLTFALVFKDGHLFKMEDLKMSSAPYSLLGEVEFGADKSWKTIHLSEFKGPHTQTQVTFKNPQKDHYDISFQGKSLDIEKFMNYINDEKNVTDHTPTDIRLEANVDHLRLEDQRIFENVKATAHLFLKGKETTWKEVTFRAKAGTGTAYKGEMANVSGGIVFDIKPLSNNSQSLEVRANDAGTFLKNLSIYDDIQGGYITVKAMKVGEGPYKGVFKLNEFDAHEVPLLARFAALLSPMGVVNLFSERKVVSMDRFECDFEYGDDLVTVQKGVGKSISLGFTVEGKMDRKKRLFSLKGNVIPARFLNSILNNIPLIGPLITGGEGEGLFAISYAVKGSFDAPDISLNPLSAFAPGFIRNLFQSLGDDE
ncbi:MAG: AsmA-like C-terminal domain-containing protein [Proteobacteria bacterium]|nr:AsmA-like C-terminal domain-containing protein [Pseudomonadota bacterium]